MDDLASLTFIADFWARADCFVGHRYKEDLEAQWNEGRLKGVDSHPWAVQLGRLIGKLRRLAACSLAEEIESFKRCKRMLMLVASSPEEGRLPRLPSRPSSAAGSQLLERPNVDRAKFHPGNALCTFCVVLVSYATAIRNS